MLAGQIAASRNCIMPYRNMSIEDFAQYLGLDARDVQKMAERGKLPGQKVGGEWRFNRKQLCSGAGAY